MSSSYPRGSEWRKWDLHVHSPYSYESKYARWDAFTTGLKQKAVEHGVEAAGISDYFTVDILKVLLQERVQASFKDGTVIVSEFVVQKQ